MLHLLEAGAPEVSSALIQMNRTVVGLLRVNRVLDFSIML
jgi:hypothetical protein